MSILNKKLKSFKRGNGMAVPALLFLILEIKSYTNKKVPANFNLIKIMPEFAFTSSFEWKIFSHYTHWKRLIYKRFNKNFGVMSRE